MLQRWTPGLFRNHDRLQESRYGTYLSDVVASNLAKMLIVSREKQHENRTVREYTAFRNYPELYKFMKDTPISQRHLHEVIPENAKQKPRFDIDLKRDEYNSFTNRGNTLEFVQFGEWVKDLVISAAIEVMKAHGITLDFAKDFMVFTSHGKDKRSYHIILPHYYHYNNAQSYAFYQACMHKTPSQYQYLYNERVVDPGIYNRNASLRMVWCVKLTAPGEEIRSKTYTPEFNYLGKAYTHVIPQEEDVEKSTTLNHLFILHHSLITFTDESEPMPSFYVPRKDRPDGIEISDETYEEACKVIEEWDQHGVFSVDENDGNVIQLIREKASYCTVCERIHYHKPSFCFVGDGELMCHCGSRGVRPIAIGKLTTVRSQASYRVEQLIREGIIQNKGQIELDPIESPQLSEEPVIIFEVDGEIDIEAPTELNQRYVIKPKVKPTRVIQPSQVVESVANNITKSEPVPTLTKVQTRRVPVARPPPKILKPIETKPQEPSTSRGNVLQLRNWGASKVVTAPPRLPQSCTAAIKRQPRTFEIVFTRKAY